MQIRLAKRIAESGVASRRDAEKLIVHGRVTVDGNVVLTPVFFVDENNVVAIDGKEIQKKSTKINVWKFYKPCGIITTRFDPRGRRTVFDIIPAINDRLIYIGRLDINSEGLLLFTNNGDFSRKMELPANHIDRTYRVRIFGKIRDEHIFQLQKGIIIDGIRYGKMDITPEYTNSANMWMKIKLYEGKNREIRKIMEFLGYSVNRLIRIGYGPISLNEMSVGQFIPITNHEFYALQNMDLL